MTELTAGVANLMISLQVLLLSKRHASQALVAYINWVISPGAVTLYPLGKLLK